MIRKVDDLWYGLLHRVHRWVLRRSEAYCRRYAARTAGGTARREALHRLLEHVAGQKPHLN